MLCWKSGISALMLATLGLSAQAQGLSPQDKNVLALLEWGGSTASALYGLVQADLHRRVPGDRYEQLAREITYQIHAGQSASALVRAPMDLAGSALYTAALVDPEPFSRTAALVGGYASKKFGEAISQSIVDKANAQADAILKRGLDESKIALSDLQNMPPQQFTQTIESLMIGDRKLAEILKDSPQSLERIRNHANDLRDTAQLATLATVQGIKGTVDEIAQGVAAATKQLDQMGKTLNARLDDVQTGLSALNDAVVQQGKDLATLQKSVEGNSAALQTLAQVSSLTWTTDQKLAALNGGLFPDLNEAQRNAMRTALLSQKKTEIFLSNLQATASALGDVAAIAKNLGVDPQVVKAAQVGQLIVGSVAAYAQGNYLGAAVGVSSLVGMGGGGEDSTGIIIGYLKVEFEKINQKLDKIIVLQEQTMQAVAAVSLQLERMQMQLQVIERDVSTSLISLQYLQLAPWQVCQALMSRINGWKPSLAAFKEIAGNPEINGYLSACYIQYAQWFDANIAAGKWGYDVLDLKVFPASGVYQTEGEISHYRRIADATQRSYDASRNFFLAVHGDAAGAQPATYLAAMLDPQPTLAAAQARDARRQAAVARLAGFRCGQVGVVHEGIRKPLCIGASNEDAPRPDVWRSLLYPQLAGPFASRLIEEGTAVGLWSTFSYISGNSKSVLYVPASDIENLPAAGMTNKLKLAMAANRRGGMLTRLEWLAEGYLLQQSLLYGDFITQLVVEELYDPNTRTLTTPADGAPLAKKLAYQAMVANETLARNAVVIALRRALSTDDGVVQTTAYAMGITTLQGAAACDGTATGTQYLKLLLPGWTFTRAETEAAKKADPALGACATANPDAQIATGFGVKLGGLFVKAPIPQTLLEGQLERPASLRLARQLVIKLANERSDLQAKSWIPDNPASDDVLFLRQLLASQCLNGKCQ
jgi:hypothetical protein